MKYRNYVEKEQFMAVLVGAAVGAVFGYACSQGLIWVARSTSGTNPALKECIVAHSVSIVALGGIGAGISALFFGAADPVDVRRDEVRAAVEQCMAPAQTAQELSVTRDGQALRIVCPAAR